MEFRTWLQDALMRKGWSGAYLARQIGVSPGAVNKWVNGKAKPTRDHIPGIARALEMSEQDVWDAVRESDYFRGGDGEVMRALNLPPDVTPDEARYLHLAYRAFRTWLEERAAATDGSVPRRSVS